MLGYLFSGSLRRSCQKNRWNKLLMFYCWIRVWRSYSTSVSRVCSSKPVFYLAHTHKHPPPRSSLLRMKFISEKTMRSFLDFDHKSYITVLSDMIPFINAYTSSSAAVSRNCSLPKLAALRSLGSQPNHRQSKSHRAITPRYAALRPNPLNIHKAWRNTISKGCEVQ